MKRTYIGVKSGIIWAFTESLGDLDFADDISLLAHNQRDIQSKAEITTRINKSRGPFAALKNMRKTKRSARKQRYAFQEQRTERTAICCRALESDQRNMPHAGSIPTQVSQKNSAHLLAKKISNAELHERTGMLPISLEVKKRRWR